MLPAKFHAVLLKFFLDLLQTTVPHMAEVICLPGDPGFMPGGTVNVPMGVCWAEVDVSAHTAQATKSPPAALPQCVSWEKNGESITVCHTP